MLKTTVYLHADKDAMYRAGARLGLTGEALDQFLYTCYEVKLDLDVDELTGEATINALDDRPILARKVT